MVFLYYDYTGMSVQLFDNPIEYLKGVGPKRAEVLKKELNIFTFFDLLSYYPFRYVDRSRFFKISEINADTTYIQLKGKISGVRTVGAGRAARLTATFSDDTGEIELVWFQGHKWVKDKIKEGQEYILFGKPAVFNRKYNFTHPDIEVYNPDDQYIGETLQGIYYSSEKLKSVGFNTKGLSKIMKTVISIMKGYIAENLTDNIIQSLKLMPREDALTTIHFPSNPEVLEKARARLKFEELFFVQLRLLRLKQIRQQKTEGLKFIKVGDFFNQFYHQCLKFELTTAQKKVIKEIRQDTGSGHQMNRLLQGDVGSGKTLVALMTMLIALDNNFQCCLMVPTEILAQQHFRNISAMTAILNIKTGLLTGSVKPSAKSKIRSELLSGEMQIVIGTHALIEDNVQFFNLGLVVIDEQHRFGVEQRARLWTKNEISPHILVMTATPIPRTLAMTLYGDLDISVIDELPPGRKEIKTYHFTDSDRLKLFGFMRKQIKEGWQIFVVYPLIEESETLDMKYLMDGYESMVRAFPLPEYAVSIVHGKMKSTVKEYEMNRFINRETNIMIATTVIEVGVDIPNATVMVIENAERFGLSQLHQLRGRIGRGAEQSYCILMTGEKVTEYARKRVEIMVRSNDGFEIAEADLRLRGPGDLEGTQQSGLVDLRLADIVKDEKILKYARNIALEIIQEDPSLESDKNRRMTDFLKFLDRKKTEYSLIS